MKRTFLACVGGVLTISLAVNAQSQNGDLSKVTHSRTIVFMTRDHHCTKGRIVKTNADSITIHSGANDTTLLKADLLFAGENFDGNNILLSGRSSWNDVTHAWPQGHELLRIELKTGQIVTGHFANVTPDAIQLSSAGRKATFAKQRIGTVDYVRFLPGTDRQEELAYDAEFLNVLQPSFYRERFGHPPTITVRLYDASLPEDNTPLLCK